MLKFTRPLFRPPFYNDLGLCKKFNRMTTLPVQITEETFFPAAERKLRHRSSDPYINTHITGIDLVSKFPGIGTTAGKQTSHIAIVTIINKVQGIINRF